MGTSRKIKLNRLQSIILGVNLIGDNTLLDGKTAYRVGRLGDACISPLAQLEKRKNIKIKESNEERTELVKQKTGEKLHDDLIDSKLIMLNNQLTMELTDMEDLEENIEIPELQQTDFVAKKERKSVVKTNKDGVEKSEVITIDAGDPLVPLRFFTLLGDLIAE